MIPQNIDLHMHTSVSDGTDTPEEILLKVKEKGIGLFSVTDHDAVKGCAAIRNSLREGDPAFITGVEFSCRDEDGKYHVLGYGFDPDSEPIEKIIGKGHSLRMRKLRKRIDFLEERFGIRFPKEEIHALFELDNPGKPHIGNLMVKYKYAESKESAIRDFINAAHFPSEYIRPEEAIESILAGGGVPVLAHPVYGDGDQLILGDEMDERLKKLTSFGLQGVEAFYSGFTRKLRDMMLRFAQTYGLYVTAGSDYHGNNKMISLGDTGLDSVDEMPEGLKRFISEIEKRNEIEI